MASVASADRVIPKYFTHGKRPKYYRREVDKAFDLRSRACLEVELTEMIEEFGAAAHEHEGEELWLILGRNCLIRQKRILAFPHSTILTG